MLLLLIYVLKFSVNISHEKAQNQNLQVLEIFNLWDRLL